MNGSNRAAAVQLFTTSDFLNGKSEALTRMIASVERFRTANPAVELRSMLLLQRVDPAITPDIPEWIDLIVTPERLSLSAARNRMIAAAYDAGLSDDAIVAFPDDDAWYPEGTLEHIVEQFAAHDTLDLWFCRYGRAAQWRHGAPETTPSLQQTLSFASSNTTVVRGRMLRLAGRFSEDLGVGTPAGGGEDTDFSMRCWHAARQSLYCDLMAVGHRDADPSIRAKYYAGSLQAIAINANASSAARMAWLRKLAVGAAFTAMGRISPGSYTRAIAAAHRRRPAEFAS